LKIIHHSNNFLSRLAQNQASLGVVEKVVKKKRPLELDSEKNSDEISSRKIEKKEKKDRKEKKEKNENNEINEKKEKKEKKHKKDRADK
jgi:hypothetical protein